MNADKQTRKATAPTHIAYQVNDHEGQSYWTRIGAAWAHKNGNGYNIQLECIPVNGRVTLRIASENK